MNDRNRTVLTGNAIVPTSGGLPNTVRKFAVALDAKIVSFTSRHLPVQEREAFPEVMHVMTAKNRLLDWYAYAGRRARAPAEALAASADLISCHVMLRYHANWVMCMAKRHHIPYWFVPHGQLDPYVYTYRSGVKHLWLRLFGRRLLREAAHVIFSTERERAKAKWFYDGANTRVVHWPVDLSDLNAKPGARERLRMKLGIGANARVLLFLGRLHSMKRALETIEALSMADCPDTHLVLVGPAEDTSQEDCRRKAAALGVESKVHTMGPVYGKDKDVFLLGSDAYISLSIRENFGHTAAESLGAANPVILSPGNDLSPELEPHGCGWFLKTVEVQEAARAIRDFAAADLGALQAMGLRGRAFVAAECSPGVFQSSLVSLRDEAISSYGTPPLRQE